MFNQLKAETNVRSQNLKSNTEQFWQETAYRASMFLYREREGAVGTLR